MLDQGGFRCDVCGDRMHFYIGSVNSVEVDGEPKDVCGIVCREKAEEQAERKDSIHGEY